MVNYGAMVDPKLLEILVCPACRKPVRLETSGEAESLVCEGCGKKYPVRDGIPVMLIDEAE